MLLLLLLFSFLFFLEFLIASICLSIDKIPNTSNFPLGILTIFSYRSDSCFKLVFQFNCSNLSSSIASNSLYAREDKRSKNVQNISVACNSNEPELFVNSRFNRLNLTISICLSIGQLQVLQITRA